MLFICFLRRCALQRLKASKEGTKDAATLGGKEALATSATADDIEVEVDGGVGGMGNACGSDAVGSELKEDERLFKMRENDVKVVKVVVATESFEPAALKAERNAALAAPPFAPSGGGMSHVSDGTLAGGMATEGLDGIDPAVKGEGAADTAMALTPAAHAFVKALRAGLGLKTALTPREDRSAADSSFDAAVEKELRTLFQRCDTDSSKSLGRCEFTRALSILSLDRHLQMYGGGSQGVVGGMEQLFCDLHNSSEAGGINEDQFVCLFRKLSQAEQGRKPTPPPRRRGQKWAGQTGKSSFDMYEERQRHEYKDEMALALERANDPCVGLRDTKKRASSMESVTAKEEDERVTSTFAASS